MSNRSIVCRGQLLSFDKPRIMGIINITPDSFYAESRLGTAMDAILGKINEMLENGADIIDIGACSTRPASVPATEEEEWRRIASVLPHITKSFPNTILSIDTYRPNVAKRCCDMGVAIINDVTGGSSEMYDVVAAAGAPYVLTYAQPNVDNQLFPEVSRSLSLRMQELHERGVSDVIVDPGFGFYKTLEDNYFLMNHLEEFSIFNCPVLVGISRKSMIYKLLEGSPITSLNGTAVLNTIAVMKGADILRVHDVKECKEVITIVEKLKSN